MTQGQRILRALRDGPGTSVELSLETGLPVKHCCAWLIQLAARGLVRDTGQRIHGISKKGYPVRPAHVYELVE